MQEDRSRKPTPATSTRRPCTKFVRISRRNGKNVEETVFDADLVRTAYFRLRSLAICRNSPRWSRSHHVQLQPSEPDLRVRE